MNVNILDDERVDDLQYKGMRIIQKKEGFRFGIDAVIAANFVDVKKDARVIDIGAGTGIIALLIAGKTEAKYVAGIEIQSEMAEMAQRSVKLNGLEGRVEIIHGDIRENSKYFSPASFDVVVTNPPYMKKGGGLINPHDMKAVSRHEILCTLEDVIKASARLLVPGGQFVMVHKPERLVDIVYLMRSYKIEPKYLRFVHPSPYKKANILLIKGMKNGNSELKMMEPLYVYDENGCYTDEINEIYSRGVETIER